MGTKINPGFDSLELAIGVGVQAETLGRVDGRVR